MLSLLLIGIAQFVVNEPGINADLGRIAGNLVFDGEVPRATIADDVGRYRPLFDVGENGELVGAVVWLEPLDADVDATTSGVDRAPAVIDQIDFHFEPQVTAIMRGQAVLFGNDDAANHNVRADADNPRNQLNIVTPPRTPYEKTFDLEPGGDAIALHCDVHAWMAGWIYVFDYPWFAVTDDSGTFRIEDVPAGRYCVRVEQPAGDLRAEADVVVAAGESVVLGWRFGGGEGSRPFLVEGEPSR